MAFLARSSFLLISLTSAACIAPIDIGDNPIDTEGDPGDTDPTTGGGTVDDGDVPAVACPWSPPEFVCTTPYECGEFCGGATSEFDADGCLRSRCTDDEDCEGGRVCVRLGDWGGGAPSSTFCEMSGDVCQCGGTADGQEGIRVCMPPEEVPEFDPVVCSTFGTEASFTWELGDPMPGNSACTVVAVGSTLDLDCTGAIEGAVSLSFSLAQPIPFVVDDVLSVEHIREEEAERENRWIKLTRDQLPNQRIIAAVTTDLVPMGEDISWWSDGFFDLEHVDVGCPFMECEGLPGYYRRVGAIRAGSNGNVMDFGPGTQGGIPGKYGEIAPSIAVQQVRERTCDGDGPPTRLSLSVVWN